MSIKNKLSTVFLFLILSPCSADNNSEYEQYQNSTDRANVEKMIYSSDGNFDGVTVIFKDSGATSTAHSKGVGSSLVVARCEAYSQLAKTTPDPAMILDSNTSINEIESKNGVVENTFTQGTKVHIFGVYFNTESVSHEIVEQLNNSASVVNDTKTIVSMKSDFGDLTLNCNIVQGLNNGSRSYKEVASYSQPDKYVEIFFEKMRDLGFKEDVFRSGNAVGVSLRYKIKI